MMNYKIFFAVALLISMSAVHANESSDSTYELSRFQKCRAVISDKKYVLGGALAGVVAVISAEKGCLPVSSTQVVVGTGTLLGLSLGATILSDRNEKTLKSNQLFLHALITSAATKAAFAGKAYLSK